MSEILLIKNMVCPRCVSSVRDVFARLDLPLTSAELGEATLTRPITAAEREALQKGLADAGFELIETRTQKHVSDIKRAVADYLAQAGERKGKLSAFITGRIAHDYSYLSDLFSGIEGRTIEQYFIELRIEKVKELIAYDQLSLTEIAHRTGFSSVHHLSAQFRKITGLTPTRFRSLRGGRRALDII